MKPRVVAFSAAIHAAIVVAIAISAMRRTASPALVDVELAAPAITAERVAPPPPPPPIDSGRGREPSSGGAPIVDRTPPRRHAAPPAPRPAHRMDPPPPVSPRELAGEPAALPGPDDVPAGPPAIAADHDAAGGPAGEGAGGTGAGLGGGHGSGEGVIDLSTRAIPINADIAPVLPYTQDALDNRITGDVRLLLIVDPLGRVGRVTVRHGLGHGLDEIATGIAMQLRFRPARNRAGQPIVDTVRWRFRFELPTADRASQR